MNAARRPLAIVAGLPEELAAVRAAMSRTRAAAFGPCRAWHGTFGGREVVAAIAGDGPVRARRAADALLDRVPCAALVGIGVAGGLTRGLPAGTLIVASGIVDGGSAAGSPHPAWNDAALAFGAVPAVIVGAARVVTSKSAKAALAEAWGGVHAVVDLESASWAAAAASHGTPWAVLRVVSDAWDEDLPGFLERCHRGDGSLDRIRVAGHALAAPSAVPKLIRLRRRVGLAGVTLSRAVGAIMETLERKTSDPALREAM